MENTQSAPSSEPAESAPQGPNNPLLTRSNLQDRDADATPVPSNPFPGAPRLSTNIPALTASRRTSAPVSGPGVKSLSVSTNMAGSAPAKPAGPKSASGSARSARSSSGQVNQTPTTPSQPPPRSRVASLNRIPLPTSKALPTRTPSKLNPQITGERTAITPPQKASTPPPRPFTHSRIPSSSLTAKPKSPEQLASSSPSMTANMQTTPVRMRTQSHQQTTPKARVDVTSPSPSNRPMMPRGSPSNVLQSPTPLTANRKPSLQKLNGGVSTALLAPLAIPSLPHSVSPSGESTGDKSMIDNFPYGDVDEYPQFIQPDGDESTMDMMTEAENEDLDEDVCNEGGRRTPIVLLTVFITDPRSSSTNSSGAFTET
jgi:hypothetical protein